MKRLAWLLLGYSVVASTGTPKYSCDKTWDYEGTYTQKDYCEDMAEALNEAHARRTRGNWNGVDCGNFYLNGFGVSKKDCKDKIAAPK